MAAITNITIDQGADFIYYIYVVDVNGNTINLSTYTANSLIRPSYTSNVFYIANIDSSHSGNGQIVMTVNSATTSQLTQTRYVYDLVLTSNNGIVSRLLEGYVNVNLGVTVT